MSTGYPFVFSGLKKMLLWRFTLTVLGAAAQPGTRSRASFNEGWKFFQGDEAAARNEDFNDSGWRTLNLPHDWSIEGPFSEKNPSGVGGGALPGGMGWYR